MGLLNPLQNFEIPLPFGYHMDLDFVRFCSEDTMISEETLDRLKDLRRQRRKQRKTLEALMGIRQEQRERDKRAVLSDVSRVTPPSLKQSTLLIQHGKKPHQVQQPDILFLKHDSSIFRQSMWLMEEPSQFSVGQTAQHLTCSITEKPHTGSDECLNMLLECFIKRMSGSAAPAGRGHHPRVHQGGPQGRRAGL